VPSTKVPSKQSPTTKKAAAKKATAKRTPVIPKVFAKATAVKKAAKPKAVKAVKAATKAAVKTAAKSAVKHAPALVTGTPPSWLAAAQAADSKKATNIRVLDLRDITTFADFFVICSGGNSRQTQAIANEVETELKKQGERPNSVEGYANAEWVLLDYGDMVVHIFTDQARAYYDLDRLWRDGKELEVAV
jgi:ribosome-associated protein